MPPPSEQVLPKPSSTICTLRGGRLLSRLSLPAVLWPEALSSSICLAGAVRRGRSKAGPLPCALPPRQQPGELPLQTQHIDRISGLLRALDKGSDATASTTLLISLSDTSSFGHILENVLGGSIQLAWASSSTSSPSLPRAEKTGNIASFGFFNGNWAAAFFQNSHIWGFLEIWKELKNKTILSHLKKRQISINK